MNLIKSIDNKYPFIVILLLIIFGFTLIYLRFNGIIKRPTILGFAAIGEALYLFYKRYLKK